MNCFVTGANGFIGQRLCERLSQEGHTVRCLVRSPEKFRPLSHLERVSPVTGDLDRTEALEAGLKDCDTVFHLAAYAKPWSKDKSLPFRININGTENLLSAAMKGGVKRFVFTSSAAVIGPSPGVEPVNEDYKRTIPFFNDYEETKAAAEELVFSYCRDGMETVIVNPPRIYGPGPVNDSNAVTKMIKLYSLGRWRIIPGNGDCIGNYVLVDDVVNGHLLAASRGKPCNRYILGGENLTFDQFFEILAEVTGKRRRLVHFPIWLMKAVAAIMEGQASITGIAPMITVPWVKKYLNHWSLSSDKAITDLGYTCTSFREGAGITLEWLKTADKLK